MSRAGGIPAVHGGEDVKLDPAGSPSPGYLLHRGDALDAYAGWPAPAAIISDGAYGVRGFHGDTIGA